MRGRSFLSSRSLGLRDIGVARWAGRVALLVTLTFLGGACANQPSDLAEPRQQSSEVDCAALWTTVRESAVASGVADGEARRLADQARLECEIAKGGIPPDAEIEEFLRADDVSLQDAPPATEDPKMVGVYFSCGADSATLGTPEQPVYLAMREIPAELTDTLEERLEGAVRAQIAGPTPEEQDRGYFSAAPPSLASAIQKVWIDGGTAVIDFSAEVAGHLGNLGTTTATDVFVIELGAMVFQFDGIDQLTLQVQGDCEQFWRLLERTCTVIKRPA